MESPDSPGGFMEPQGVRPRRHAIQDPQTLAKYDYPPDYEERAVELILEQAELFAITVPV